MRTVSDAFRSTPVQWLPVLSNITPPHIRRQEAVVKMVNKIHDTPALPLHDFIFHPPKVRLESRRPVWLSLPDSDWSSETQWQVEWSECDIRNKFLIADPTQRPPGFDLPRHDWTLLNRYRTGHGRCAACIHDWGQLDSPLYPCGQKQTMLHIVEECPLTKFPGGLGALHKADKSAVEWLRKFSIR